MSTLDQYLNNSLKALERWRPALQVRLARRAQPPAGKGTLPTAIATDTLPSGDHAAAAPFEYPIWPPTLSTVLESLTEPPAYSAVLGICEDGLPFLFDLSNPAPGALLLVGEAGSGKTRLLRAILHATSRMIQPDKAQFSILAAQPEEYSDLGSLDHCQELFPVEEPGVEELIDDLVEITEKRKLIGPQDPVYLLVIDDLTALLPFLDERSFSRLYWLIRHGPRYRVWTLAGLAAEQSSQVDGRFLSAFRTRLFGYLHNDRLARRLAGDESLASSDLEKGSQFLVPYSGDWLRFWLCDPDLASSIRLDYSGGGG